MADVSVTIVTGGKTWGELKEEASHLGIPEHATFSLHGFKSYNAIDWDEEKIDFHWTVGK